MNLPKPINFRVERYESGLSKFKEIDRPIKLSANESALGPSPKAIQAFEKNKDKIFKYPESDSNSLREALSEKFDIMTDEGKLRRYEGPLFDPKRTLPENWSFPSSFEHIVNETSTLIKADNKDPEPVKEPKVTIDQPVKMTPSEKKEVEAKDSEQKSRRPDKKKKYRRRGQSNSRPPKKKGP